LSYKAEIYKSYVSNQTKPLYGELSLKSIEEQFSLWDYMYQIFLPTNKLARILDMGCGAGAFVYYLQNRGFKHIEGIDISDEQIKTGRKLGIENIHLGNIIDWIEERKDQYDLIIARDVLEHFSKQEVFDILEQSYKSLKNNGKMMIQVPNGEGIWHEKIFYGDFTHETIFSEDSIRQIFLYAGFSKVSSYPLEFPSGKVKSWLRKIAWRCMVYHQRFRRWIATGNGSGILTPNLLAIAEK